MIEINQAASISLFLASLAAVLSLLCGFIVAIERVRGKDQMGRHEVSRALRDATLKAFLDGRPLTPEADLAYIREQLKPVFDHVGP
jgi:hypothetical protein